MNFKLVVSGSLFACLMALNYNADAQTKKTVAKKPAAGVAQKSVATPAEIAEGKLLVSKTDCVGCHNPTSKMVGPAYIDIAKKYPMTAANVTALSQKVIKGGSGQWGAVPMSPHTSLTTVDAQKMVKYILSIK